MRAIRKKSLEKFFGQNKYPEFCCTTLAEALQRQELELWTIFVSIKEFTEICLTYWASTVETKLEIKWKTIQIIMFCLFYHYSTYMIQSIECTGLSGMAWQNSQEQNKVYCQPVMGKADISTLKACQWTRAIPGHYSSFHQVSLPCFRGSMHCTPSGPEARNWDGALKLFSKTVITNRGSLPTVQKTSQMGTVGWDVVVWF